MIYIHTQDCDFNCTVPYASGTLELIDTVIETLHTFVLTYLQYSVYTCEASQVNKVNSCIYLMMTTSQMRFYSLCSGLLLTRDHWALVKRTALGDRVPFGMM